MTNDYICLQGGWVGWKKGQKYAYVIHGCSLGYHGKRKETQIESKVGR